MRSSRNDFPKLSFRICVSDLTFYDFYSIHPQLSEIKESELEKKTLFFCHFKYLKTSIQFYIQNVN